MHADIKGCLANINKAWRAFEHKGKPMTKQQVKTVLEYGVSKGYNSTADFKDEEIDRLLKQ